MSRRWRPLGDKRLISMSILFGAAALCGCQKEDLSQQPAENSSTSHSGESENPPVPGAVAGPPAAESWAAANDADTWFEEITEDCGIDFVHQYGLRASLYQPQTMAGGGGFFDYDNDGDLDLLCLNGVSHPSLAADVPHQLYRNDNGQFVEVGEEAGIAFRHGGMGALAADFNNDGFQDIVVTGVHRVLLFLNEGDGSFAERGEPNGLRCPGWTTAAAAFDYDRDGNLDLALGQFVAWTAEEEDVRQAESTKEYDLGGRDYSPLWSYESEPLLLFRGRGDGTFEDARAAMGIEHIRGKVFGLAVIDADDDGWLDLLAMSDGEPAVLLHNQDGNQFEDLAYELGLVSDVLGNHPSRRGIDTAFINGRQVLALGSFAGSPLDLFEQHESPSAEYVSKTFEFGIEQMTVRAVTKAVNFLDVDLDGQLELLAINGHVGRFQEQDGVPYEQHPQCFQFAGETLREVDLSGEPALSRAMVGRGASVGDIDGDG